MKTIYVVLIAIGAFLLGMWLMRGRNGKNGASLVGAEVELPPAPGSRQTVSKYKICCQVGPGKYIGSYGSCDEPYIKELCAAGQA